MMQRIVLRTCDAVVALCVFAALTCAAFAQSSVRIDCYSATAPNQSQCSAANPLPMGVSQGGNTASVSLDGALSVSIPANPQFTDLFSTALDTTTNWTTNNSGGTTATSNGALVVSGTTTLSQYGGLSTKQSWSPAGISPQVFGISVAYNTLAVANSVRIFGVYTPPGTPTLAAPITDGYVFRLDATGALFAEVWASGAAISSTNITSVSACTPIAGTAIIYYVSFRTNLVQFGCGQNPSAAVTTANPINQTLPISAYSIAGLSAPSSAATMTLTGISLSSLSPNSIKSANQSPTINDSSAVNAASPVAAISTAVLAANQIVAATPANLYSFEVSADATLSAAAWWVMVYDAITAPADGAVTPKKCFALPLGTTSYAAAFPAPVVFTTGIVIGVSTTGCFSKTASVHAFISGDAK